MLGEAAVEKSKEGGLGPSEYLEVVRVEAGIVDREVLYWDLRRSAAPTLTGTTTNSSNARVTPRRTGVSRARHSSVK
jgi:hypothetical protein